jgi:hypothetical protein
MTEEVTPEEVTPEQWIEALLSGKYKRTVGVLYSPKAGRGREYQVEGGMCCLGVLADLMGVLDHHKVDAPGHGVVAHDVVAHYDALLKKTFLPSWWHGGQTVFSRLNDREEEGEGWAEDGPVITAIRQSFKKV